MDTVTPPLFAFEAVDVTVGDRAVLSSVTATVPEGCTGIVGPSGAGKSTLLRLCNRLEVPTAGTVRFRGEPLEALDPLRLRRRVGMVFQTPVRFPGTVADNLRIADADPHAWAPALAAVGLGGAVLHQDAASLSGGEAQRMCLARTLLTRPEVLLLDEPTSSLDAAARLDVERAVAALAARGVSVLLVSHDAAQVRRLCTRALLLDGGRLVGVLDDLAGLAGQAGPLGQADSEGADRGAG